MSGDQIYLNMSGDLKLFQTISNDPKHLFMMPEPDDPKYHSDNLW